jgi:hypothetical protein
LWVSWGWRVQELHQHSSSSTLSSLEDWMLPCLVLYYKGLLHYIPQSLMVLLLLYSTRVYLTRFVFLRWPRVSRQRDVNPIPRRSCRPRLFYIILASRYIRV